MSNDQTGKWDQPHALSSEASLAREICRSMIAKGHGEDTTPITPVALLAILDAHANDLADMARAISQIEEVYMHITGGSLSKWQTDPIHIKQAHDDAVEKAEKDEREHVLAEVEKTAASFYDRNQCGEGPAWFDASEELRARIAKLRSP